VLIIESHAGALSTDLRRSSETVKQTSICIRFSFVWKNRYDIICYYNKFE